MVIDLYQRLQWDLELVLEEEFGTHYEVVDEVSREFLSKVDLTPVKDAVARKDDDWLEEWNSDIRYEAIEFYTKHCQDTYKRVYEKHKDGIKEYNHYTRVGTFNIADEEVCIEAMIYDSCVKFTDTFPYVYLNNKDEIEAQKDAEKFLKAIDEFEQRYQQKKSQ